MARAKTALNDAGSVAYHTPGAFVRTVAGGDGRFITGDTNSLYSAGKTLYNAPGRAVEAMGGNPQFITGETNSLYSAGRATGSALQRAGRAIYDAPGKAVAYMTGKPENQTFMTNSYKAVNTKLDANRKAIRESAKEANADNTVIKRDSHGNVIIDPITGLPRLEKQSNRSISNLGIRTLDSVLQSAQNAPKNAAAAYKIAKEATIAFFQDAGLKIKDLSVQAKKQITAMAKRAGEMLDPVAAFNYMKDGLSKMFGKNPTSLNAEFAGDQVNTSNLNPNETFNPLTESQNGSAAALTA